MLLHDFESLNRLLRNGKLKIRYKAAVMQRKTLFLILCRQSAALSPFVGFLFSGKVLVHVHQKLLFFVPLVYLKGLNFMQVNIPWLQRSSYWVLFLFLFLYLFNSVYPGCLPGSSIAKFNFMITGKFVWTKTRTACFYH